MADPASPFATPSDFWRHSAPPDSLFEDASLEPGSISAITHAGTGLGALDLDERSNPWDAWGVTLTCLRGGEMNLPGVVNVGLVPQFQVQLYTIPVAPAPPVLLWTSRTLTPDCNGLIKLVRGGFGVCPRNATSGAPVTIGAGNSALVFTPLISGCSVVIVVGGALGYTWYPGSAPPISQGRILTLTVTSTTTAAQAAAWLAANAADAMDYMAVAAGGNGSGIVAAAGSTPLPLASFVAADTWSCTTAPSPDVVAALAVEMDFVRGYLKDTYNDPLLAWGLALTTCVTDRARWRLVKKRGLDVHQDFKVYAPKEANDWLNDVADGTIEPPTILQPGKPRSFPLLVHPINPLSREADAFPI